MAQIPRIRFDPASGIPAIHQIAESLRILLVEGKLAPGMQLPSVRRLAIELGVHFNTVAEAYRQIAAEGWLELKHGRGAVVVPRTVRPVRNDAWMEDFRNRLRGMVAQMRSQGAPVADIAAELRAMAKEVTRS
jgi:DNA-binding transcriptional regulator YhcF (GntR family)